MTANKTLMWLLGGFAGMAAAAIVIGLALVGVAVATSWGAGSVSAVLQHPMFGSGSELVRAGLFAALPLLVLWLMGLGPQRAGTRPE